MLNQSNYLWYSQHYSSFKKIVSYSTLTLLLTSLALPSRGRWLFKTQIWAGLGRLSCLGRSCSLTLLLFLNCRWSPSQFESFCMIVGLGLEYQSRASSSSTSSNTLTKTAFAFGRRRRDTAKEKNIVKYFQKILVKVKYDLFRQHVIEKNRKNTNKSVNKTNLIIVTLVYHNNIIVYYA